MRTDREVRSSSQMAGEMGGQATGVLHAADTSASHVERKRKGRFTGRRAKKPKLLALVTDSCTGCAGAPVCQICCPVDRCMLLMAAEDAVPFGRIWVDPLKCVGCRKCLKNGPHGTFIEGCPWDAIMMVPTREWEMEHGELSY